MDTLTPEQRHKCMQRNIRKDTTPELSLRHALREAGYPGYRLQWKVPGRPDISYPGRKIAIFVNGCFWHRCPKCNPKLPSTNTEYWIAKFEANKNRDKHSSEILESMGWTVFTAWECEIKNALPQVVEKICLLLKA